MTEKTQNPGPDTSTDTQNTDAEQYTLTGDPATHPTLIEVRDLIQADSPAGDVVDAAFIEDTHTKHSVTFEGLTIVDYARMSEAFGQAKSKLRMLLHFTDPDEEGAEFIENELAALEGYSQTLDAAAPEELDEILELIADYTGEEMAERLAEIEDDPSEDDMRGYY